VGGGGGKVNVFFGKQKEANEGKGKNRKKMLNIPMKVTKSKKGKKGQRGWGAVYFHITA